MSVTNTERVKAKSSEQNNKVHHEYNVICGKTLRPTHSIAPHYSAKPADGTILLLYVQN